MSLDYDEQCNEVRQSGTNCYLPKGHDGTHVGPSPSGSLIVWGKP